MINPSAGTHPFHIHVNPYQVKESYSALSVRDDLVTGPGRTKDGGKAYCRPCRIFTSQTCGGTRSSFRPRACCGSGCVSTRNWSENPCSTVIFLPTKRPGCCRTSGLLRMIRAGGICLARWLVSLAGQLLILLVFAPSAYAQDADFCFPISDRADKNLKGRPAVVTRHRRGC